jgi:hypothetical protein
MFGKGLKMLGLVGGIFAATLFVTPTPTAQADDWGFSYGHGGLGFHYGDHGHHHHHGHWGGHGGWYGGYHSYPRYYGHYNYGYYPSYGYSYGWYPSYSWGCW